VDFLLVLIELFSLCVTAEALCAKIDRKSAISLKGDQFDPKFQIKGVCAIFLRKLAVLRFLSPFWGLKGKVRISS